MYTDCQYSWIIVIAVIEAENQMISLFINALNKKLKMEMLKNVNFYKTMQQAESQAILLEQIYGTHHDNPTNES